MGKRFKYLNLFQIRLPLPGAVSIMHRGSGAVLFLALPLLLYWLQQSLISAVAFEALKALFNSWFMKVVALALLWGYFHHLCAGLRHLLLDLDIGVNLTAARRSSWIALIAGIALTACAGVLLW